MVECVVDTRNIEHSSGVFSLNYHRTRSIQSNQYSSRWHRDLEFDDFGISYSLEEDLDHLEYSSLDVFKNLNYHYQNAGVAAQFIQGAAGNNVITANSRNNEIIGHDGSDIISSGSGNDVIRSGDGNDILIAGSGSNLLQGGDGDDIYVFDQKNSSFNIVEDSKEQ